MVQLVRAPYEIGEEIRGMLRKILQTKRNKMGRKKRPYIHQLCRNMINPYSTNFLTLSLQNWFQDKQTKLSKTFYTISIKNQMVYL